MAELIVEAATIYAALGGVVAVVFLVFGIDRIDASARGAYAVRPLLAPGVTLLWPYVLIRWAILEWRRA